MNGKKSKKHSMVTYVILLLMLSIVLQSAVFFGAIVWTNITVKLESFSYNSFTKTVNNRVGDLERFMTLSWNNIASTSTNITGVYNDTVGSDGVLDEDEKVEFLKNSAGFVMDMMSVTGTTGGFVILDDGEDMKYSYSTIYLKSDNYLSQTVTPENLMLAKGPTDISKEYGFSLVSSWSYGISLTPDSIDMLTRPMEAVGATNLLEHLGYWNVSTDITNDKLQVLTFSVPLLDDSGVPIGVVGIEVSQSYLYRFLPADEFGDTSSYGYLLATMDGDYRLTPIVTNGTAQSNFLENGNTVQLVDKNFEKYDIESAPKLLTTDDKNLCVYYEKLDMYPNNTPFVDSEIYLVGMVDVDRMSSFTSEFWTSMLVTLTMTLCGGIILSFFIGKKATAPIMQLRSAVSTNDVRRKIDFKSTGIVELDDLGSVIKQLQQENIIRTATKTDKILELLNIGVGSFEFIKGTNSVSVSQAVHKMLDIDDEKSEYKIQKDVFFSKIEELKKHPVDELKNTYSTRTTPPRYYTIEEFEQEDAILGVIEDSTKEVQDLIILNYERNYDVLTGIFNRRAFHKSVEEIFQAGDMKVAGFVMFDLDNLKYVNDTFGHDSGDIYIKTAANIISMALNKYGVVGRMSGDEFYAYLHGFETREALLDTLNKLYKILENEPIEMPNGKEFQIRMSGGIAWYEDDSIILDELMKYADFAMYKGKQNLKGELREFDKRTYINESFMLSGKEELNRILDNELVNFLFQPIIDVSTGKIHAYEALMRPMSDTLSSPMKFLQIASLEGKLWKVEKITFFKTLFLYKKHKEMFNGSRLFINSIPIENLTDREYFELQELYGDCLPYLVVEITEQEQQEEEFINAKLEKLHSMNLQIALDDYGSGYANDVSLLNIRPNIVKIDRSLITNVHIDPSRQTIINKIITFCKENDITVLGEGIETEQEFEYMINAGIQLAQGYYIARPMESPDFDTNVIQEKVLEIRNKMEIDITKLS